MTENMQQSSSEDAAPRVREPYLAGEFDAQMDRLLTAARPGSIQRDVPLGRETWYRVGGPARVLASVRSAAEVSAVVAATSSSGVPIAVIGAGSNLLIADNGFDGVAIRLERHPDSEFSAFEPTLSTGGEVSMIRLGAAETFPDIARRCADNGISGLEWAAGIPGTVGGSVRMNAGINQDIHEVRHVLVHATVLNLFTGQSEVRSVDEFAFGYRESNVAPYELVVDATFRVRPGSNETIASDNALNVAHRKDNQETVRTGGSVWRNPPGTSAWAEIEKSGCAQLRIGSAQISPKHSNFIIADRNGRADDVYRVMVETRRQVFRERGVMLHPETCLLGFTPIDSVA